MSRYCFGDWKQRRAQLVTVLEQEYQLKSWDYRRQLAMPAELVGKPRLGVIRRCKHLGEPSTYTGSFRVHLPTTGLNTSYSGLKKSVQSASPVHNVWRVYSSSPQYRQPLHDKQVRSSSSHAPDINTENFSVSGFPREVLWYVSPKPEQLRISKCVQPRKAATRA